MGIARELAISPGAIGRETAAPFSKTDKFAGGTCLTASRHFK